MKPRAIELHPLMGSGLIARWGWEPHPVAGRAEGILALELHRGGTWHYLGVPERVFEDFVLADSKGKFFLASIKDAYPSERVDEPEM